MKELLYIATAAAAASPTYANTIVVKDQVKDCLTNSETISFSDALKLIKNTQKDTLVPDIFKSVNKFMDEVFEENINKEKLVDIKLSNDVKLQIDSTLWYHTDRVFNNC